MSKGYDYNAVEAAWIRLQSGQLLDTAEIRDFVAASWMRCIFQQLDPASTKYRMAAEKNLSETTIDRPLLFNYLFSHLNTLESSGYFLSSVAVLTNASGHVLKLIGNGVLREQLAQAGIGDSSCLSEAVTGTNAIGLCLHTRKPACVYANEHYLNTFKGFYCAAAPILDHNGELVAALGLFTEGIQYPFDVALVTETAGNIGREIRLYHKNVTLKSSEKCLDVLMNSINNGVLLLSAERKILKANSVARYLLLLYEYELIGLPIDKFISQEDIDFSTIQHNLVEQPVTITTVGDKKFQYIASVYLVAAWDGSATSYILTLNNQKLLQSSASAGKATFVANYRFDDIVGTDPSFVKAINLAKIAAKNTSTVLITGESGTGKELFAQSIHNASRYSKGPFVAINCGAIPKELIESELFGYEDGAFTGAKKGGAAGKFELANGGTIFLDEIGDMPYNLQISLLRFLQNHEITRIGGKRPVKVDVRIITATNKNLEEEILKGLFRSDLYYRINIFSIMVPSLRERACDISNLAHYFLQKYKSDSGNIFTGFSPEALAALQSYPWPGNVREIENVLERTVLTCHTTRVELENLPHNICEYYLSRRGDMAATISHVAAQAQSAPEESTKLMQLASVEKNVILNALEFTGNNVTRAAEVIGISRRTLYRKLEKYGIRDKTY